MSREEIDKEISRRYPISPEERRGCQMAKALRNTMRSEYRKRLEEQGAEGIKEGVIL